MAIEWERYPLVFKAVKFHSIAMKTTWAPFVKNKFQIEESLPFYQHLRNTWKKRSTSIIQITSPVPRVDRILQNP